MCVMEFMVRTVHGTLKRSMQSLPNVVSASHAAKPKCMPHGVHGGKRDHGQKRVYGTIESKRSLPHVVRVSHVADPKCMSHGFHG